MPELRLVTRVGAGTAACYRLALSVPVQQRALAGVRARAVGPLPPDPMPVGATVTWAARWAGLPWRMTTRITAAEADRRFVDEQVRGPFGHWHHEHRFCAAAGGTDMVDLVSWSAPGGPLGRLAAAGGLAAAVRGVLVAHNRRLAALIEAAEGAGRPGSAAG